MSWDDIESENSLFTLASTSPNSAPPRTELVKSAPKQTKVKFNTMSTNDQLLFHSTTSLTPYQRQQGLRARRVIRSDDNHSLALHLIQLLVVTGLVKSAPNYQCDSKTVNIDQITMYLQVALIYQSSM